jgi:kynurenine formamidase
MKFSCTINGKRFEANLREPVDISIPLSVDGKNPSCYWADPAKAETIVMGDFIGSVKQGGPVNYQKITITPHGNGTHTECYGHITAETQTLNQCLRQFHFTAELITVTPEIKPSGDYVISKEELLSKVRFPGVNALVIRTMPNDDAKLIRHYSGTNPPYLEGEAARWMAQNHIDHLLIDLPSIDREVDGGQLSAHKQFWQYPANIRTGATITELIYVPASVNDGLYLLILQITSLETDASPSKPLLYKLTEVL